MFLSFGVENYKSIKDEQEFSFIASNSVKEHEENLFVLDKSEKVLKSSVIYGRNASGKSNLLEALSDLLKMITESTDLKLNEPIPFYRPFLFDESSKNGNSKFWVEIVAGDDIKYFYEVVFNKYSIVKETLDFYPKGYPANLFTREGKNFKYGDYLKGEKKSIENQLLNNQLYLSKAVINNHEQLKIPYLSIKNAFSAIAFKSSYDDRIMGILMEFAENDKDAETLELLHNINEFLKIADTGIMNIEPELVDSFKDEKIPSFENDREAFADYFKDVHNRFNIKSFHKLFDNENEIGLQDLPFQSESEGTKRLAVLGALSVVSLVSGSLLIIDELNNSLHPLLTSFLVKLYHSDKYNKNHAQLLFTTHDTSVLSSELLRRDQVWFAEKDKFGKSNYYSISDFQGVRPDTPIEKWYLSGRFGAIPVINDVEPDLKI